MRRDSIYLLMCATAPVLAVSCACLFAAGAFEEAWLCGFGTVLTMEARVQAGERLPHTAVFWTHLVAAVPFFLCMTALAFFARGPALETLAALLGLAVFCSGAILWYRGLEARVLHLRQ